MTSDDEVGPVLMGATVVVSNDGEFLMVETMISNKSKVVRSVRVVVSSIRDVDVMAGAAVPAVVISLGD